MVTNKLIPLVLGAMGLHSYLAKHHIEYGSPESVEFTNIYFMLMNYWTLVESNNIARERQETFVGFEKSKIMLMVLTLTNTLQANTFLNLTVSKNFFDGHFIPQAKDWEEAP